MMKRNAEMGDRCGLCHKKIHWRKEVVHCLSCARAVCDTCRLDGRADVRIGSDVRGRFVIGECYVLQPRCMDCAKVEEPEVHAAVRRLGMSVEDNYKEDDEAEARHFGGADYYVPAPEEEWAAL